MRYHRAAEWTVPHDVELVVGHTDPEDPEAEGWVSAGYDARGGARVVKEDITGRKLEPVLEVPVGPWRDDRPKDRPRMLATGPPLASDETLALELAVDHDVAAGDLEFRLPLSMMHLREERRELRVLTERGADRLEDVPGQGLSGPEPTTKQLEEERIRDLREIYEDQLQGQQRPSEGRPLSTLERWWHQQ